jgi:glycosyltransferase involved in cell wall biosynthesis
MRIAVVSSPWFPVPPPDYGGTERVCDVLARGLSDRGHEVTIYAGGDSDGEVRVRATMEHDPARHRHIEREGRHLVAALEEAGGFDVIHNNTTAYGALIWSLTDFPVVHTVHTEPDDEDSRPVYAEASRRVPLVAISHAQRDRAPELGWVDVIHNPIDITDIPMRPDGFDRPGRPYVLFMGRLAPEKGAHLAIEAAQQAGVDLVLAGPALQGDYVKQRIEPHLAGNRVRHLGPVGGARKWELLHGATALLFPLCWSEPFGLVAVEAMAAGVPVIAFASGGTTETILDGETGFLVQNTDEMAAALGEVHRIDAGRCRDHVAERFAPGEIARRYEAVLEQTAHQTSAPAA